MTRPPREIGGISVPGDPVSAATWAWARRTLPQYLLAHSVRSYCWGATIGTTEGLAFDPRILWAASLMHDVGLTRVPRNTTCFEFQGARTARRFLAGRGMPAADARLAARAIELHMAPSVTLDDGAECVLLDRATGLDVRGVGYELIGGVRDRVVEAFPRGAFDVHFLAAIRREVAHRPGCQSERLLVGTDLEGWMARSPWSVSRT